MKIPQKLLLIGCIAVGLLVFLFFRFQIETPPISPANPAHHEQLAQPGGAVVTADSRPREVGLVAKVDVTQHSDLTQAERSKILWNDYQTAPDLRIFVERMRRSPQNGGALYALHAVMECKLIRAAGISGEQSAAFQAKSSGTGVDNVLARQSSFEDLSRRCASFTEAELAGVEQKSLLEWAVNNDELFLIRRKAYSIASLAKQEKAELLGRIVKSRDPILLELLRSTGGTDSDGMVPSFAGVPYAGLDPESYFIAWDLAICRAAGSCGYRTDRVKFECAAGGQCASSLENLLEISSNSKQILPGVRQVADRIFNAIINNDVNAFVGGR